MDGINVSGNVYGHIITGDNNVIETHDYYGAVINQQAALPAQRRSFSPKPPRKPIGFVGRKLELKQMEDLIASATPVIVHGLDGIGKTSLAKQAANSESAKAQPDGVVFLEGLDEAGKLLEFSDLIQRLFDALFESQPPLKVDMASARTYLSNTQPLVLLSSLSFSAEELHQLPDLFPSSPILIATEVSDRPDNFENISLGPLAREDSLTLLSSLTSAGDQQTLAQIAALLENVPAALIMVKKTISEKGLKVDEAFARLQSYTPNEKDKVKAGLERAFALVFSTLTEDERGMLIQTAAAHGVSVDRKWLESVYGGSSVSEKLESLELLQANSPRLRLMPGLRSLLLQGREVTKERERLLSYLLTELKTRGNDFEFLHDELGNLLGLLFWSAAQGQWSNVAALGRAMDPYLTLSGYWGAWRKTLGEVHKAAQALGDLALQGWVLHQLGSYEIGIGNQAAARKLLEQAISTRKKIGDQTGMAYSQHNLQIIAPVIQPANPFRSLIPWALGGLGIIALVAFLIFNNPQKNQPQSTSVPIVAPSEVKVAVLPSATQTVTGTLTETPSSSPTVTDTLTPSSIGTPIVTPTYAIQSNILVNDLAKDVHAACFYGPGRVYLNKGTARIPGNKMDVLGRIETDKGVWVNTRFSPPTTDASDPCWMDAKYLDITAAQLMSVLPIDPNDPNQYRLPIDHQSIEYLQDPVVTGASRDGVTVTVQWVFFDVGKGQYPNHNERFFRYLMEAWLCKAGKIVFSPSGWGPYGPGVTTDMIVSAKIQDEPGCTEPSHARLYLAWAHGYVGPVEIKSWPQNESVLPTSTPTP
ncbi:MAG TPA: ATP-binding protein [Anaerolineales bacterium]|nr:ATP-binding protein [Anaerolineales bacterium]